jgi:hypothetical protein
MNAAFLTALAATTLVVPDPAKLTFMQRFEAVTEVTGLVPTGSHVGTVCGPFKGVSFSGDDDLSWSVDGVTDARTVMAVGPNNRKSVYLRNVNPAASSRWSLVGSDPESRVRWLTGETFGFEISFTDDITETYRFVGSKLLLTVNKRVGVFGWTRASTLVAFCS